MQRNPPRIAVNELDGPPDAAAITKQLSQESGRRPYSWLPDSVRQLAGRDPFESELLRGVFTGLLKKFTLDHAPLCIPCSIGNLYERELERIKALVDTGDQESLRFGLDVRQKDIAILTYRLIPVGAEFAEPWSAIGKRQALAFMTRQPCKAANYFILKKSGFWPYFQLHMHQESHADFNEDGWMKMYGRLAELLQKNPGHRGWFSSSWLVDPALARISPHLSCLRTVPENNGGVIFYVKDDPAAETGALLTSRTRRRLFEAGLYQPRIYMRVWPRTPAIAWWRTQVTKPACR